MAPGLEHTQCLEEVAECWRLQHQGKGRQAGDPEEMLTQALFLYPRGHLKECQQDPAHQPNTQTSVNNSGRRERRPDPTVSHHLVVYFNQPNNSTCVT